MPKPKIDTTYSIRDWFDKPYDEKQMRLRDRLVPNPRSMLDGRVICTECEGEGLCKACDGTGEVVHVCDCPYCDEPLEGCPECNGTRDCRVCEGTGES